MIYILVIGWILNIIFSICMSYEDHKDGIDLKISDLLLITMVTLIPYLTSIVGLFCIKEKYYPNLTFNTVLIKGKKK